MKRIIFVTLLATFALGGRARADLVKGSQTAAIFGGVGGSNSEYDFQGGKRRAVSGSGGAFGAQYLYYVAGLPAIAFGADLSSSLNGNLDTTNMLPGYVATSRTKSLVGMAIARLAFPRGHWRPYLFAGVGAHDSVQQLSARPRAGTTWVGGGSETRMLVDERATSAAVGYGIGLDFYPTECLFIGAELRNVWLAGLDTDNTDGTRAAGFAVDEKQGIAQGNLFFRVGVKF